MLRSLSVAVAGFLLSTLPPPPRLPTRHKEFLRHVRREYTRLVSVLQAYALIRCGCWRACRHQHYARLWGRDC